MANSWLDNPNLYGLIVNVRKRFGSAAAPDAVASIDTSVINGFLGYGARRAYDAILSSFIRRMAPLGLRPLGFTLLALAESNPGITSSQLCELLDVQSSNLVGIVNQLQDRKLVERKPHPTDGRAMGLYITVSGLRLLKKASKLAHAADDEASARLTSAERETLSRLLRKFYI